jgi:hypothetical protein
MENLTRDLNMGYRVIKSVDSEIDPEDRNIFVFTPERAMQLLANYPNLHLDFFFYDEVYKIDEDFCYDETDEKPSEEVITTKKNIRFQKTFLDESRAKTFRVCLYLLSKQVPDYYLAGPNLSPEKFGVGIRQYLELNNVKLKTVSFEPTCRIRVEVKNKKIKEMTEGIACLPQSTALTIREKKDDTINDISQYISDKSYGQTLYYCTTPAKANEYASKLAQERSVTQKPSEALETFMVHLQHVYDINGSSNEWSFLSVLRKGFAMHHGKLPKYIQKEVLDLFNSGVFTEMFCTSTIVEGVNTNARNMVVLNASKGREPLTAFDLKNIVGRAGRYYHNFVGRYFLVGRDVITIADSENLSLNFATYDAPELDGIDLDNADMPDLQKNNADKKQQRMELQRDYMLPDIVFYKNRLIKKEVQEKMLRILANKSDPTFDSFNDVLGWGDILNKVFIQYKALSRVLSAFEKAGLLDNGTVKKYSAVSISYCDNGFRGILKYEIDIARKDDVRIDKAYEQAFRTQKEIIEHKIPKLLALFESLFIHAAKLRNINIGSFTLSRVIRFYETGVRSYFGEQLVEFGFPTDAIRKIEEYFNRFIKLGRAETLEYFKANRMGIMHLLDNYEQQLILRAVQSIS